jgi:hypothetical protein
MPSWRIRKTTYRRPLSPTAIHWNYYGRPSPNIPQQKAEEEEVKQDILCLSYIQGLSNEFESRTKSVQVNLHQRIIEHTSHKEQKPQ